MFAIFLVIFAIVFYHYKYGLFREGPVRLQSLRHRVNIRERMYQQENMAHKFYPSATRSKDD